MPDLIARILRELDEEIVRLESELSRVRVVRARVGAPMPDVSELDLTVEDPSPISSPPELRKVEEEKAPETPQEATPSVALVEPPPEAPEAKKPDPVLPGISPELAEKLAKDSDKVRPLSVTHVPSKEKRKTERRVTNRPVAMRSPEEMETAIRDWVRARGDELFTAADLAEGIGINTPSYAIDKSKSLIERGVIIEVGRAPGRGAPIIFKYGGKPAPAPASARDDGNGERAPAWKTEAAIAGTGRQGRQVLQTTDKDINALLRSIAGQIITRPGGSGHVIVTCRRTGQATSVSSTPSATNTIDKLRADLRRIGVRF